MYGVYRELPFEWVDKVSSQMPNVAGFVVKLSANDLIRKYLGKSVVQLLNNGQ